MKTRWEFVQYLLSFPSTDRWCQWACNDDDDDHDNSKVWSYDEKIPTRCLQIRRTLATGVRPLFTVQLPLHSYHPLWVSSGGWIERILAKKPRCDSSNFSFPYLTAFYFSDTRLKRDFSWRSSAKRSLEAYQGCLNFFSLESSTW